MEEPLIERDEIVALLFCEQETTMAKRKQTKAEREEFAARYERAMANVRRTRELAELAQAKLDAQRGEAS